MENRSPLKRVTRMDGHTHHHTNDRRELQMARSMCWHCQSEVSGEYFCDRCVKVQPVSKELDYFTCFGIPRRLALDQQQLETKFYELSRAFHPDFYQNKSDAEQTISLGNSAMLNTAYRTLRDPIQRAEYLLDLEAGSVKEIRTTPPADLFEEILELQDTLDEFRASDRTSDAAAALRSQLQSERTALEGRQRDMETQLQQLFGRWDSLQDRGDATDQARAERDRILKDMRDTLSNRTYVKNIVNDLVATIA
ncbi:Co-chaperone protein HscB (Hsc20) (modular protein) [Nitrospira lenta]|uniref:Co-chaperone protein HscB (Hsc20) (Modular protein) n=2 Tax=Nitrospira lenta TaxID=1436998 RepID=A0A330L544_9BACT|nr:Co-chaperone protein HscB (Hsc20) (modular protein) [Nitrospira lenta]